MMIPAADVFGNLVQLVDIPEATHWKEIWQSQAQRSID